MTDKIDDGRGDPFEVFRPDIPSPARMYDYVLGGKDHYPADRKAAEEGIGAYPPGVMRGLVRQNRAFLQRAVRYLVSETDVRQFIDIGAGLPTVGPVHEIAQNIAPESHVVYVDNDMVVIAHSWEMLSDVENATVIRHDLRSPEDILADPELRELIDFDRPVAVLLVAILHYIDDTDDPAGVIRRLLGPLPAGSHLVISHFTPDTYPTEAASVVRVSQRATTSAHPRTRAEVAGLLEGLQLVEPGLVWIPQWHPDPDTGMQDRPEKSSLYAAVARKVGTPRVLPPPRAQARRVGSATREEAVYGGLARQPERPETVRPARMYDYYLDGSTHFPAERRVADQVIEAFPPGVVRAAARHNRAFIHRAVHHLASETGVRQFIDIGAGIPTTDPIHQIAQTIAPESCVIYLDNDLVVITSTKDVLADVPNTATLLHDLRAPEDIVADLDQRELIDFDEPVAVLLGAVLHYIGDEDDPADVIGRLLDPLAAGSHVVLTHASGDTYPAQADAAERIYRQTTTHLHTRTRAEVTKLIDGLDLLDPGLVWAPQWRPEPGADTQDDPEKSSVYAAVVRKP